MAHVETAKGWCGDCAGEEQPLWAERLTSNSPPPLCLCVYVWGLIVGWEWGWFHACLYSKENRSLYSGYYSDAFSHVVSSVLVWQTGSGLVLGYGGIWVTGFNTVNLIILAPPKSHVLSASKSFIKHTYPCVFNPFSHFLCVQQEDAPLRNPCQLRDCHLCHADSGWGFLYYMSRS